MTKPLALIASYASGDARTAYNALEIAGRLAATKPDRRITREIATEALQKRVLLYDKSGEQHYDLISALHKSIRNSDVDASLYWLGRMLAAGEDPLYVARRLVRMASEDIGLAAPEALNLTLSARDAMDFLGSPEGELALAQAAAYLALAPKSNAVYTAWGAVTEDIENTRAEPVPLHLRNAPTKLMQRLELRQGLPVRARHRRQSSRHGLPARKPPRPPLLPPHQRRPRKAAEAKNGRDRAHSRQQQTGERHRQTKATRQQQ